jgi:hypothetical protein
MGIEDISGGRIPDGRKQTRPTTIEGDTVLRKRLRSGLAALREFFYGMTVHEMDVAFRKEKGDLENLFMLVVFGDLVGLPLLPPYYSMRLLPFILPSLNTWKRRVSRERDLTDLGSMDIG